MPRLPNHQKLHKIPVHTPSWHDFRKNGIGGSETSPLIGLSETTPAIAMDKYKAAIRVFYEKVGLVPTQVEQNEFMFFGSFLEDKIKKAWSYYDGTPMGHVDNYVNKKVFRKCYNIGGYVVNDRYPWLFSSIDGAISPGSFSLITGKPLEKKGILEAKNVNGWALKQWEGGLNPAHIGQVSQYMIVFEVEYAEIAMLVDGHQLVVEPVKLTPEIKDMILDSTHHFWYDRVLPARGYAEKRDILFAKGDYSGADDMTSRIHELEPPPEPTQAYKDFLVGNTDPDGLTEELDNTDEEISSATEHKNIANEIKALELKKQLQENILIKSMVDRKAKKVVFTGEGNMILFTKKNSDKIQFRNNIKV